MPAVTRSATEAGGRGPILGPLTEALVETLLESVGCGVLLFGSGGELWSVNDQFAQMVEAEPERLLELDRFERVVAALVPRFAEPESTVARWRERFQRGDAAWDELELAQPRRKTWSVSHARSAMRTAIAWAGWKSTKISPASV